MPARALRHYKMITGTAATWQAVTPTATPTARAMVGRAVVTCHNACTLYLGVGGNGGDAYIGKEVPLQPGEIFEQAGIILLAGEQLYVHASVTAGVNVHFFAEEVDN